MKTAVNSDIISLIHKFMAAIRGRNSVVECHLPMVNVVGSSPIARFGKNPYLTSVPTIFPVTSSIEGGIFVYF